MTDISRRVIHAKRPPPVEKPTKEEEENQELENGKSNQNGREGYTNPKSPDHMREEEENWRMKFEQDRYEATTRASKTHKDDYVQQKRSVANSVQKDPIEKQPQSMEQVLSVEPEHPEHKRADRGSITSNIFDSNFAGAPLPKKKSRQTSEASDEPVERGLSPLPEGDGEPDFWLGWKGATVVAITGVAIYALLASARGTR